MKNSYIKLILSTRERITVPVYHTLVISSRLFQWNSVEKKFTANASRLDNIASRLACHIGRWGFVMRSHKTNRCVWFEYVTEHKECNKVSTVEFCCPELDNLPLTVYND